MVLKYDGEVWYECTWTDTIRQIDEIREAQYKVSELAGKASPERFQQLQSIWRSLQRKALRINRSLALKLR